MRTERFKDLFWFAPKSKIKAGEGLEKGRFPFYTSSQILSKYINTEQYFDESLVFGTGGSASIHHVDEPFSTSTDCIVTISKDKGLNTKYVYYYLFGNIQIIERGFKGAGLKHIAKSYIEDIEIPLPDLETQNKIVAILDRAKIILDKRKKVIKQYDELLRATFLEMFGDPFFNPKKWVVDKLENYLEYIGDIGSNGSNEMVAKNLKMLDEEDYAIMIRTVNLSKNDFNINVKYVSEETYNFFRKSKIFGGEIIMNKIGSAGEFWMMPFLNKPVSLGLNQLVIRTKHLDIKYLFHLFSTDYGKALIKSKIQGTSTKSITKTAIREFVIIIPPIDLQNTFSNIVTVIENLNQKLNSHLESVQNLNIALLQLAFKGELDFNTAVDLEILLENDYAFFKENSSSKSIQLLLERLNTNELNENKFYEQQTYNKAKSFVFELLKEGKVKQVFDENTKKVKLTV